MASTDAYLTIGTPATDGFVVRGSKFLGHATPVESIDEAKQFVQEIETEYADATHNVPAYRVRADPLREYASDDGEPSGSAGKPTLSMLQKREIENACVVVTRYFGGTELGIGGLVRSYSRATKAVLDAAGIVERRPRERFSAVVEYDESGTVRGIFESEGVSYEAEYDERVTFDVSIPVEETEALTDRLRSATGDRIEIGDRSDL